MEKLLIVLYVIFLDKEGSCGHLHNSRFVWVITCVWATLVMHKLYLVVVLVHVLTRYRRPKFSNNVVDTKWAQ